MRHGRDRGYGKKQEKHEGGQERRQQRQIERLERKVEKQAEEMKNLKAQMKQAGLVARVEALEEMLGGPWV